MTRAESSAYRKKITCYRLDHVIHVDFEQQWTQYGTLCNPACNPSIWRISAIDIHSAETHLGIVRSDDNCNKTTITEWTKCARWASYSLMGAGLKVSWDVLRCLETSKEEKCLKTFSLVYQDGLMIICLEMSQDIYNLNVLRHVKTFSLIFQDVLMIMCLEMSWDIYARNVLRP